MVVIPLSIIMSPFFFVYYLGKFLLFLSDQLGFWVDRQSEYWARYPHLTFATMYRIKKIYRLVRLGELNLLNHQGIWQTSPYSKNFNHVYLRYNDVILKMYDSGPMLQFAVGIIDPPNAEISYSKEDPRLRTPESAARASRKQEKILYSEQRRESRRFLRALEREKNGHEYEAQMEIEDLGQHEEHRSSGWEDIFGKSSVPRLWGQEHISWIGPSDYNNEDRKILNERTKEILKRARVDSVS